MTNLSNTVNTLKESLTKIKTSSNDNDENDPQPVLDILERLDECSMTLETLTETLIGTVVSKLKNNSNENVKLSAKKLVKKWKQLVKQSNDTSTDNSKANKSSDKSSASKPTPTPTKPSPSKQKVTSANKSTPTATSTPTEIDTSEWDHLPPNRKKMTSKFHEMFSLSKSSLQKVGMNPTALSSLSTSRAAEVEEAVQQHSKGNKIAYADKLRSLLFNLKKNEELRNQVLLGQIPPQELVTLPTEKLATAQSAKRKSQIVQSQQDSWRLDWEQANESKVNEICGIKGDLLNASLFTCGRCKSVKTTSTQKQTRSADEPMTVFVFCMNCGNRWKC